MPEFEDTPTAEGATNVSLNQRAATAPFAREEVNIRGSENAGRALGFDTEGRLSTLLVGGTPEEPSGPIELADMAPLPSGTVIGRKAATGGVPEAVTVPEMIALDPAGTKAAIGKIALVDMASLAQGRLIARASSGTGVPEAVTLPQVIALDPAAARTALGKVALSDMANLARGTLIARVSTSPNPGVPEAVTLPQVIAIDPEAVRVAMGVVEDPFVMVDTQAQFDAALAAGRSMVLRGSGTGGVIALTTPKTITARYTEIKSDAGAVLSFTLPITAGGADPEGGFATDPHSPQNTPAQSPCAITIMADDVTLRNFELTHPGDVTTNTRYGIVMKETVGAPGHRLKLLDLHIHNWGRCINKDAEYASSGLTSPIHEDVLIERCYIHTFNWSGIVLNFGMRRLKIRDSRVMGRVVGDAGDPQNTHHNCIAGGSNWYDCVIEDCYIANCGRIAVEILISNYTYFNERTRMSNCLVESSRGMGISFGFTTEAVLEKCRVKNVHYIGIELAGTYPERDPGPDHRYASGVIESCEIDGVDSWTLDSYNGSGQGIGISIDGAENSVVRGTTRISNITSSLAVNAAAGIGITGSENCSVRGATLTNAGFRYLYVSKSFGPNTRGHHEIIGNTCRNLAGAAAAQAVYVHDTRAEVQQNVAWQKHFTDLLYCYNTALPAYVSCDGGILPPAGPETVFPALGSNVILAVP